MIKQLKRLCADFETVLPHPQGSLCCYGIDVLSHGFTGIVTLWAS